MAGFPKSTSKNPKLGEKAKQPHPAIPLNKEIILQLIQRHRGNLSRVADSMGSTRTSVRTVIDKDEALKTALDESRARWIDDIEESVLSRAHETNDTGLQCFVLKTQGRHRGWDQDQQPDQAKAIATAAFEYVMNKTKASSQ